MFSLGNLKGTIMLGDTPILEFEFRKNTLVRSKAFVFGDRDILPFEFWGDDFSEDAVRAFFEERITPDTRIGLQKSLEENGMEYYDPETLIRFQGGRCVADDYWVKF